MSSWKKAAKVNQKTHRERHQPEARGSLGILEKKKDYVKRAKDFNQKKNVIRKLRNVALSKNPDEFYFHMVNSRLKDGKHVEIKPESVVEHSLEQLKLMENRNHNYVSMKRTIETKKIQKLQSEMHLTDVAAAFPRQHIIFNDSTSEDETGPSTSTRGIMSNINLASLDSTQQEELTLEKQKAYAQLAKQIERENQLKIVQRKMEVSSALKKHKGLPAKCIKQGTKTEAAVFLWKYERKR